MTLTLRRPVNIIENPIIETLVVILGIHTRDMDGHLPNHLKIYLMISSNDLYVYSCNEMIIIRLLLYVIIGFVVPLRLWFEFKLQENAPK